MLAKTTTRLFLVLPSSVDPAFNGLLKYENLAGEDSISLLLQEKVVSIL